MRSAFFNDNEEEEEEGESFVEESPLLSSSFPCVYCMFASVRNIYFYLKFSRRIMSS